MTQIQLLPTAEIDEAAFPRDRTALDPQALEELQRSIAAGGLRQPIEVYATEAGHALVSGYRRLLAFRALEELHGERFATIPAFVRPPEDALATFARVVEENDIRAGLSAWERGHTLVIARDAGHDSLDAALAALYPHADRRKKGRLRALAEVVEEFEDRIAEPELWSENRLLRLAGVLRYGWEDLLHAALDDAAPGAEWEAIAPLIAEAESLPVEERRTPNRPKRLARLSRGITFRRERTEQGYLLHITGRRATDAVVGEILDHVLSMFIED